MSTFRHPAILLGQTCATAVLERSCVIPFSKNGIQQNEHIVRLLLAALRFTVEELAFLAGSVMSFSKDLPLHLQGAAYLEVENLCLEMKYEDLCKLDSPPYFWTRSSSA